MSVFINLDLASVDCQVFSPAKWAWLNILAGTPRMRLERGLHWSEGGVNNLQNFSFISPQAQTRSATAVDNSF